MNRQQLRNVLPGGIHHKVASDWAASDDAELLIENSKHSWVDAFYPEFSEHANYRLKPKTLRYRVAEWRGQSGPTLHFAKCAPDEAWLQQQPDFVKWIGDWQEVEVPHC